MMHTLHYKTAIFLKSQFKKRMIAVKSVLLNSFHFHIFFFLFVFPSFVSSSFFYDFFSRLFPMCISQMLAPLVTIISFSEKFRFFFHCSKICIQFQCTPEKRKNAATVFAAVAMIKVIHRLMAITEC